MSRSYKEPYLTDSKAHNIGKRFASKKVRRFKGETSNGKWYRKVYDNYEIVDYRCWWDKATSRRK